MATLVLFAYSALLVPIVAVPLTRRDPAAAAAILLRSSNDCDARSCSTCLDCLQVQSNSSACTKMKESGGCLNPRTRTDEVDEDGKKQTCLGELAECGSASCVKRVFCVSPCICDEWKTGLNNNGKPRCRRAGSVPYDAKKCEKHLAKHEDLMNSNELISTDASELQPDDSHGSAANTMTRRSMIAAGHKDSLNDALQDKCVS